MKDIQGLKEKAKQLRKDILTMTTKAKIGHVTSSFSCTELMTALYYADILKYKADDYKWDGRDYFILSKGHANPVFYCILADLGFIPKEELDRFSQAGGNIGVLLRGDIPGTEITSGSLGCGLGIAAGIAHGLHMDQQDNKVVCMVGDAECREGAIWESAMHIGTTQLNNLITIVDKNGLGATHFLKDEAGIDPIEEKFASFGFDVIHIDGHNFKQILDALKGLHSEKREKPLAIIADTVKGKGVSFIENVPLLHGAAVKEEQLEAALKEVEEGEIG